MVDFAFDIQHLFPQEIIRVQPHMLRPKTTPQRQRHHFHQHTQPPTPGCKLSTIIDAMGHLSAVAQDLKTPITTAEKLLTSTGNQVVYLMADNKNGRWVVSGLLKVGKKDLFVFDEKATCRRADQTPAILDFYVHESRQRCGLGKVMFERMLSDQGWLPQKCSVDRPSPKLLGFLAKHYGLRRCVPQGNNFVVFPGFFEDTPPAKGRGEKGRGDAFVAGPRRATPPMRRQHDITTTNQRIPPRAAVNTVGGLMMPNISRAGATREAAPPTRSFFTCATIPERISSYNHTPAPTANQAGGTQPILGRNIFTHTPITRSQQQQSQAPQQRPRNRGLPFNSMAQLLGPDMPR